MIRRPWLATSQPGLDPPDSGWIPQPGTHALLHMVVEMGWGLGVGRNPGWGLRTAVVITHVNYGVRTKNYVIFVTVVATGNPISISISTFQLITKG